MYIISPSKLQNLDHTISLFHISANSLPTLFFFSQTPFRQVNIEPVRVPTHLQSRRFKLLSNGLATINCGGASPLVLGKLDIYVPYQFVLT